MNRMYLIELYRKAVEERDALNEGTLTEEETAGYWVAETGSFTREEFNKMLKELDILLSKNSFYAKVNSILQEVGV